jgi:formylglycine-generating enzyme required for sulfatase activity
LQSIATAPTQIDPRRVFWLPGRLAQLGFTAHHKDNMLEYIAPPVCKVPAGPFLMGSNKHEDPQASEDELPQHSVALETFQIAKYPVTVAEYACFVRATKRMEPRGLFNDLSWTQQISQRLDHPVVNISWRDAVAYAKWLAQCTGHPWRLPSEAEWEKAGRGTDGRIYPWGDLFDAAQANTVDGERGGTTSIGSYPSGTSPYGALDMAGNVWEWTSSIFKPYPYIASDGREQIESTGDRVLRGGSWAHLYKVARVAYRNDSQLNYLYVGSGFRVAYAVSSS